MRKKYRRSIFANFFLNIFLKSLLLVVLSQTFLRIELTEMCLENKSICKRSEVELVYRRRSTHISGVRPVRAFGTIRKSAVTYLGAFLFCLFVVVCCWLRAVRCRITASSQTAAEDLPLRRQFRRRRQLHGLHQVLLHPHVSPIFHPYYYNHYSFLWE